MSEPLEHALECSTCPVKLVQDGPGMFGKGIVRANSFTLPQRQNRISWPLIFLHFSGSI